MAKKEKKPAKPGEYDYKKLKMHRKSIADLCRDEHQKLDAAFEDFYNRNPAYRPTPKAQPMLTPPIPVGCSEDRFFSCEKIIYDYPNGNRKIVTWEKVPKTNNGKGRSV